MTTVLELVKAADEKRPMGLFLDGTKLNALGTLVAQRESEKLKELGEPFDCYRFPVGQYMLTYYLCPNSSVEVDSHRYLTLQQDEDEALEDFEYCQVVFKDTVSQRDTFEGGCTLSNVATAECKFSSSDLSLDAELEKMFNIYIHLELADSEVRNGGFSEGAEIAGSVISDVSLHSRNRDKVRVYKCDLQYSQFNTDGMIEMERVCAENSHVNVNGLLKIVWANWSRVRITGESINIPGPMYFLEVQLPRVKFYVYQTADDKWAIAPDTRGDRFSVGVDNPHVEDMLREVLTERGQIDLESCLQYIYDSIASRIKVMEAIEHFLHVKYLRLSAVL